MHVRTNELCDMQSHQWSLHNVCPWFRSRLIQLPAMRWKHFQFGGHLLSARTSQLQCLRPLIRSLHNVFPRILCDILLFVHPMHCQHVLERRADMQNRSIELQHVQPHEWNLHQMRGWVRPPRQWQLHVLQSEHVGSRIDAMHKLCSRKWLSLLFTTDWVVHCVPIGKCEAGHWMCELPTSAKLHQL